MINLLTGTPGAGKTCYLMDFLKAAQKEKRPIFVHGIPGLKIDHQKVYCRSPACTVCEDRPDPEKYDVLFADEWHEWAPVGGFLVFDEVQHIYRPRGQSQQPPDSVKAFETHRHKGLDFWLVSQNPTIFDSNVRKMVSRHIHLKVTWANRVQYEWPECQSNVQNYSSAIRSSYKLNKENFRLYKSAEIHTKQKRKIPAALWVSIGALILVVGLGWRAVSRVQDRMTGTDDIAVESDAGAERGSAGPVSDVAAYSSDPDSPGLERWDYTPVIPGIPETAPAFQHLPEVTDYPRLAGCVYRPDLNRCNCYTQQGTPYETSRDRCMNFVYEKEFDPYRSAN